MHSAHMDHSSSPCGRARVTLGDVARELPGSGVSHCGPFQRAVAGKCPISIGVAGIHAPPCLALWGRSMGQHREHPPQDKHRWELPWLPPSRCGEWLSTGKIPALWFPC